MNRVFHNSKAVLAIATCLFASLAVAQSTSSFPELPVDAKTLRVQNQAEEVYKQTDYERAFRIYRHDLVPIGDKYGQYMVGFMYLTGKGVAEDRVAASAWYRLAAERDIKVFNQARDRLMASLSDAERVESDRMFIELRKEYADIALLTQAVRKDYEKLRSPTGSRLGAGSGPMTVIDMTGPGGRTQSGADFYGRIERRMKARLDYIAKHAEIGIIDLDSDSIDIDSIERQVAARLNQID